jgi:hypothetical protein
MADVTLQKNLAMRASVLNRPSSPRTLSVIVTRQQYVNPRDYRYRIVPVMKVLYGLASWFMEKAII